MISGQLSEFITKTGYKDLPADVVKLTKVCFLDWLGCTIAGSVDQASQMFLRLVREAGGTKESTVIPSGDRTSCLNAALANGAYSHVLELDDIHKRAMYHPGIPVIPAALAVAEREKAGGKKLIAGIALGYETGIRIGVAVNPSHFRIWHTTGTAGTFAAAAAGGKILDLDREQMINALGNAGTQAAGLWQFNIDGAMTKPLHPGKAAMNGLIACLLAKQGFTGARNIFEGEKGFGVATSEKVDYEFITANLGKNYEMLGIGFKIHAGCRHTNSPVDGALKIVKEHDLSPEDIKEITIYTYKLGVDLTGKQFPTNPSEAKFSIPYCVASAILYRRCSFTEFSPEKLRDRKINALLKKTRLVIDEEIEKNYAQGYASIVEIATVKGEKFSERTDFAKGDPENPVSVDEIEDKFRYLAGTVLASKQVETIIETVRHLEEVTDINELIPLFCKNKEGLGRQ
ncbi:MAG: MmgE/PrpD family protein [Peptococcaceae bacterium]|jgi:2-methylcitrate dehydratase PrpD|nr:MmgE/PrpD family protein [Peptococcaceae bacterium]MDH7526264.1 MmgE/PrpD family protein [Peptococcaceae bacterium]